MRAVGAVNCDPPGGARVSVVPLLTPRKSCGGRACGFPRGVAGVVVQEGNDGVGWLAGRGGLLENSCFSLVPGAHRGSPLILWDAHEGGRGGEL